MDAGLTMKVTFPVDVLKTRIQAANGSSSANRISMWKVGREAIRTEGWRVMFAGLGPTLIR